MAGPAARARRDNATTPPNNTGVDATREPGAPAHTVLPLCQPPAQTLRRQRPGDDRPRYTA